MGSKVAAAAGSWALYCSVKKNIVTFVSAMFF